MNNWECFPTLSVLRRKLGRGGIEFDEKGSAVTEFVMVATPLFLPAILFFNALHSTASEEINVSHIARQAVRAFATSSDLQMGHARVKYVLDRFAEIENSNSRVPGGKYGFTYNIKCGAEKCLTPGSLVELELFRSFEVNEGVSDSKSRKANAIARTYVDKWREIPNLES